MPALEPNFTILPQMILFAVAMYLIHSLILKPYTDSLRLREGAVEGAKGGADSAGGEADEIRLSYERQLDAAHARAEQVRAEARGNARTNGQGVLDEAAAASAKTLSEARAGLRAQVDSARAELGGEARLMAKQMAEAALGRSL